MVVMLVAIFLCVAIGLFVPRFGSREIIAVVAIAILMSLLYLVSEWLM